VVRPAPSLLGFGKRVPRRPRIMELEERTIEQLPDRCANCGAQLTDAEKQTALTEGPPGGRVLCTICAAEVVPLAEDEEELEG
jgi:hypothetical protein